jgi:hypothetical protein
MLADRFALGFPTTEFQNSFFYAYNKWVTPTQAWIDANGNNEVQPDGEVLKRWDYVYRVVNDGTTASTGEPNWTASVGGTQWSGTCQFQCYNKTATLPFVTGDVITNLGTGNPPITEHGILISNAMIGNAAIENAHILDATITSAKISDLSASKITAGTINIGSSDIKLGSPNFTLRSDTRRLTVSDDQSTPVNRVELGGLSTGGYGIIIRNGAGNIMLRSGDDAYPDELDGTYIKTASIDSLKIENELTSSNWNGSNVGFRLGMGGGGAGTAEFNSLIIRNAAGETLLSSGSSAGDFTKAGSGINIIDGDYSNFQAPTSFADNIYVVNGTAEISTEQSKFRSKSLKVTSTGSYVDVYLGVSATDYNMDMAPNSEWIGSLYVRSGSPRTVSMYLQNTSGGFSLFSYTNPSANSWNRMSGTRDMAAYPQGEGLLRIRILASSGIVTYLDGIMLEQKIGSGNDPSGYYAKYGTRKHPDWLTEPVVHTGNPINLGNINDLLQVDVVREGNKVTVSNADTFISTAAIGSAYIADLEVGKLTGDVVDLNLNDVNSANWGPTQIAEGAYKGWNTLFRFSVPYASYTRHLSIENYGFQSTVEVVTANGQQITLIMEWRINLNNATYVRTGSQSYAYPHLDDGSIRTRSVSYNESNVSLPGGSGYDVRIQLRSSFTSNDTNQSAVLTNTRRAGLITTTLMKKDGSDISWTIP